MTVRLVCWDLDGTLTDSVRFVVECANEVIGRRGGRALAFAEVAEMTGLPLEDIFRIAFDDPSDELLVACRDEYRAYYREVLLPRTRLHEGGEVTLRALHQAGIRQATVTGKRAGDCESILRMLGVGECFDLFLGGDSVPAAKPAPDLVLHACRELHISPAETLVVGDTRVDMEMGRRAGAATCLVLWGVREAPTGLEDHLARTFDDVGRIVESKYTPA